MRMRSFFRFLYQRGETANDLSPSALSVANWRLSPLRPKGLDQLIGIILFPILFVFVWDFANKHERQFNRELAPCQVYILIFDTTFVLGGVTY